MSTQSTCIAVESLDVDVFCRECSERCLQLAQLADEGRIRSHAFAVDDSEVVWIDCEEVDVGLETRLELFAAGLCLGDRTFDASHELRRGVGEQLQEEVVLRLEVLVQDRLRDSRCERYVVHRRRGEAVGSERRSRRNQELLAAFCRTESESGLISKHGRHGIALCRLS